MDRERHGVVVPLWYERDAVHMQNRVGQQRVLMNLAQYITSIQRLGRSLKTKSTWR
jgi:hypothetical protein